MKKKSLMVVMTCVTTVILAPAALGATGSIDLDLANGISGGKVYIDLALPTSPNGTLYITPPQQFPCGSYNTEFAGPAAGLRWSAWSPSTPGSTIRDGNLTTSGRLTYRGGTSQIGIDVSMAAGFSCASGTVQFPTPGSYVLDLGTATFSSDPNYQEPISVVVSVTSENCTVNTQNLSFGDVDAADLPVTAQSSAIFSCRSYAGGSYGTYVYVTIDSSNKDGNLITESGPSQRGVGISLALDGQPVVLGQKTKLSNLNNPKLSATLQALQDRTVTAGAFTAVADVSVEYQ
ncbi:fimbrial protein [Pantoea sp. PNT02]|uniref:fimbrial protein n=1 Tax=Pantoea sp. PNT02 TaxID=2769261 RepID=UPI001780CB8A|nr:fimbrial protein [Pantoea sp. PNT02]MBD9646305.1 fimbrial protein [Pantoea sp. PNT02]